MRSLHTPSIFFEMAWISSQRINPFVITAATHSHSLLGVSCTSTALHEVPLLHCVPQFLKAKEWQMNEKKKKHHILHCHFFNCYMGKTGAEMWNPLEEFSLQNTSALTPSELALMWNGVQKQCLSTEDPWLTVPKRRKEKKEKKKTLLSL